MRKTCSLLITLLLVAGNIALIYAQQQPQAPATSAGQRKTSEPYTGDLSIFETPGRDERLQINRVMEILSITQGKAVADIGAGSGWFTVRAAKRVGAAGVVYAVDINPEAIRYIGKRAQKEQLQNVKAILSKPDDPLLPGHSIDAVLLVEDLPRGCPTRSVVAELARSVAPRRENWGH